MAEMKGRKKIAPEDAGWIGVDLDGTLAEWTGWKGPAHIGKVIPKMAARVRKWTAEGREVRIMTARVSPEGTNRVEAGFHIQNWLMDNDLPPLRVTSEKDLDMIELWDDRAVQMIPNTGKRVDGRQD